MRILITSVLLTVAFPRDVHVSAWNVDEENMITEFFNNCRCVPSNRCDDDNKILPYDSRMTKPSTAEASRIECRSSWSEKYYCCKSELNTRGAGVIQCGKGQTPITPRIYAPVDESLALKGEYPWMVGIFLKGRHGPDKFIGGGSLIHPNVVLTANHLLYGVSAGEVVVVANGDVKLSLEANAKRAVSQIVRHPDYEHTGHLYYDAALLILDKPYTVSTTGVNTLCLPPGGVSLEGTKCTAAGWGRDSRGKNADYMKKIELPFVNHRKCDTLLKNTRLGPFYDLHESFMCAGGEEGKDACVGDGGGPLMCAMPSEANRYFQAGIVSWGIGCGSKNVPGVYADVSKINEWIRKELGKRSFDVE